VDDRAPFLRVTNLAKTTDDSTAIHCTEICLSYLKVIRNLTRAVAFPPLSTKFFTTVNVYILCPDTGVNRLFERSTLQDLTVAVTDGDDHGPR